MPEQDCKLLCVGCPAFLATNADGPANSSYTVAGTDDNDFPLLSMGVSLAEDLDAIVRTVSARRICRRNVNMVCYSKNS